MNIESTYNFNDVDFGEFLNTIPEWNIVELSTEDKTKIINSETADEAVSVIYNNLSTLLEKGMFDEVFDELKIALAISRKFNFESLAPKINLQNYFGILNFYLENYELAIQFYHLALNISGNKSSTIYNNIADTLVSLSLNQDAKKYYKLSLSFLTEKYWKKVSNAPVFYSNYCSCLISLKEYEEAKMYFVLFKEAIASNDKYKKLGFQLKVLESKFLKNEKDYEGALLALKEGKQYALENQMFFSLVSYYKNVFEIENERGNVALATKKLRKALELSEKYNIDSQSKVLVKRLIGLYKEQNDFEPITELAFRLLELDAKKNINTITILVEEQIRHFQGLVMKNNLINSQKKDLEQLAYIMAHDLREPLRNIQNFTELVKIEENKKKREKYIDILFDSSERMGLFLKDILDYLIIGSEQTKEPVEIAKIIENIQIEIQTTIKTTGAIINCSNLPTLYANKNEMHSLFMNLITNALKFTKKNIAPIIAIDCEKQNDLYIFRVKDNGIGIGMEHKSKVFEIFKRLHTRSEINGNGIGLSLCRKIIDSHDGDIWLESEKENGTTVYFSIPVSQTNNV